MKAGERQIHVFLTWLLCVEWTLCVAIMLSLWGSGTNTLVMKSASMSRSTCFCAFVLELGLSPGSPHAEHVPYHEPQPCPTLLISNLAKTANKKQKP